VLSDERIYIEDSQAKANKVVYKKKKDTQLKQMLEGLGEKKNLSLTFYFNLFQLISE